MKLPNADIPVPPQYVPSSGGLYSTHEVMVRSYRRQLSLSLLGSEKTADHIHETRYIINPAPNTEGYKLFQNMLGKQRRIDYIQADGNCLFRALSKEILGHEKFHHTVRQTDTHEKAAIYLKDMYLMVPLRLTARKWKLLDILGYAS